MFCKYCGQQIPDGGVCSCSAATAQRNAAAAPQYAQPQYVQQPQYTQPQPQYVQQPQYTQPQPQYVQQPQYSQPQPQYVQQPQYTQAQPQYVQQPQYNQAQPAPAAKPVSVDVNAIVSKIATAYKSIFLNPEEVRTDTTSIVTYGVTGLLLRVFGWMMMLGGMIGGYGFRGVYFAAFLCGIVAYLLPAAACFVTPIIGRAIRREKIDIISCLGNAVAPVLIPSAFFFIAGLFYLITPVLGTIVLAVAVMAGILAIAGQIKKHAVPKNNILAILIVASALAILSLLLLLVVFGIMSGVIGAYSYSSIFGSLF